MKISLHKAKSIFSLAALILVFGSLAAFGQTDAPFSIDKSPLPAPTSPVMDYAGVIDASTKASLEKRVIDYKNSTGVEFGVAVVKTTGDRPIFDYSLAVARGWGIGSKEDDNPGALLFIAIDDRKYFTQVSRNLEDELPDSVVGSLQRQYLVPQFRNGNYSKGIADTIDAYIRTIDAKRAGTATPTPASTGTQPRSGSSGSGGYGLFCCLAIILVVILIIWSNRNRGGRSGGSGWGSGGSGGGSVLPWIIGSAIANAASSSSSSSSDWGGSSWGGSGGSDWGGFGGGGDFGGGGAGGDW